MSQHTINNSNNFSNNANSFNVWNNYTLTDDRSQILAWLSPLEASLRHRDVRERRVNNIGEWVLRTEEFRRWCGRCGEGKGGGDSAVMFCYGDPGVGKTFISSLVVDSLCDQAGEQNVAITCFYFDFAARKEQSATSMLGSLLKQMVSGMERVPDEISRPFQKQKKAIGGCQPQLVDIVKMLQAITSSQPTFICIDALDECVGVQRFRVLDSLKQVLEKSPTARIFMTGRPHIRAEIEKRLSGRVMSLSIGPKKDDITTYLHARLGEDETPEAMDESLEADILEKMPRDISEMFLLISLNIDAILGESTIYRRRERLRRTVNGLGLGDAYGATIERMKAQGGDKSRLGMEALMWISHAERPLKANELCHALAVELGSTVFNSANVPSMSTLVSCCQGLITVDKEASTVRLVHYTLQEYLSAHPHIFSTPHSSMADACLTYLNSEQVKAIPDSPSSIHDTPFLEYSSLYWGVHAKRRLLDHTQSLALELLQGYDGHISTQLIMRQAEGLYLGDSGPNFSFSGLHYASFFGIPEVVTALIEMECSNTDGRDFLGCTPLSWAARNGHEEVVEILLEQEAVNPDKPDNIGRTPLQWAARNGHERVVKILLGREEVDPDKPDDEGQTPLSHAAQMGREEVVVILLGQEEVNPDRPDNSDKTPLSHTAGNGHEGVVKILLEREEINHDKPDNNGQTPLSHAAQMGREGVVEMLLRQEQVNPDKPDNSDKTPLSHAAGNGHAGVVKILLEREEVNLNKPDNNGQTPLSNAAQMGREVVVEILLGQEGVNPNKPDNSDKTPLSHTAGNGHEGVVKILLEREEVNRDKPDNNGLTPLANAAQMGREGVVEILLQQEEVNPDRPSNNGQTPLSHAAGNGHEGVVKILLEREEVNRNKPDNNGQTPLSHAAQMGREGVVEMLLEQEEVNPDTPSNNGQTPLSHAAQMGHEGVGKILLAREGVNPDKPDRRGRTPLSYAARSGHEELVKILLEREEVNPDEPASWGQTPLSCAAEYGHEGVVRILLGRREVNPDNPTSWGQTPLSFAAKNGHDEVVKILLGRQEVNPNKRDNFGMTPLMHAARGGHTRVIELLKPHDLTTPRAT